MEAAPTRIIDYFSGFKQNLVPLFQRPYTWEKRQWQTLWNDLFAFYGQDLEQTSSTHFMGAVVTMPAKSVPVGVSKFLVIDGQQRLTTVALLLCAIRDSLSAAESAVQRRIQVHYLTNDGYEGLDLFKLLPTQGDRPTYSLLIQKSSSNIPDSQFSKAYDFFRRRLKEQDDEGSPISAKRILEILESRLMAVMINLSDSDDPYLIFESLNFKGSPLEQSDLVRNYFLMRFPVNEQQGVYDNLWLPMQQRLGTKLTDFMRHFLGAEGDEVRKGDVYAGIRLLVADYDSQTLKLLIGRMETLSTLYSRIAGAASEPNDKIRKLFDRFQQLDFGTASPLLLSLYEDYEDSQFSADEFIATLAILDSYIVRRSVVGVPSNSLSGVFISLCKAKPVTETPATWLSASLAQEHKNRRWPTDLEFRDSWLSTPIYNSRRVCRVLLESLEQSFEHHETVDFGAATVEHILPQTITAEWSAALGADALNIHVKWLHTIGNLTLTGYNPALGNKTYSEKRAFFANSHFELNRYFADKATWDALEIQERSSALFTPAEQMWPRPPSLPGEELVKPPSKPANFHADCVAVVQKQKAFALTKISQTRYESGNQHVRLVCAVSTEHDEEGNTPYFWFAFHLRQLEFLECAPEAFLCLGCGSPGSTLLIPLSVLKPLLKQMSESTGEDRHYWHVVVQKKNGNLPLRLLGSVDGPDLTDFLVRTP
jgi:uncharacterized protein with ParB-like and HNH nuclease domain